MTLRTLHVFAHTRHLGVWHSSESSHFLTLALVAGVRGVVEFVHPVVGPSALFWSVGEIEVGLEGPPECCGAWKGLYRVVLVFAVCCFHVPHFFRHFGRDLGKVFLTLYMYEAA